MKDEGEDGERLSLPIAGGGSKEDESEGKEGEREREYLSFHNLLPGVKTSIPEKNICNSFA